MNNEEQEMEQLLQLFLFDKKRELVKYCKTLEVNRRALANLILAGRMGVLAPYRYACHFFDYIPKDVQPTDEEVEALGQVKVGERLSEKAASFFRKIDQTTRVRRVFAAHLFYTPCRTCWYLFYFDQRDTDESENHWQEGAHIHLVTDHSNLVLDEVWAKVGSGDMRFPKLHVRFQRRPETR